MLDAVERKIEHFIDELDDITTKRLYAQIPAGKRLRAKLILKIASNSPSAIKLAAVVEMIHAASLLHDDVIDDAYTRRNKPSINASFGNKVAIMLGDILYSKGFYELNSIDGKIAQIISNAVTQLSLGEQADVMLAKKFNASKQDYMKMIYQKTASLIEASSEAAAILANKDRVIYRDYGRNIGMAFQIIDDILDITASSEQLGKPALNDFVEGKSTLPYIYLYEALQGDEKAKLLSLHAKRLKADELAWMGAKFKEYGIIERCVGEARALAKEALDMMMQEGNESLQKIAQDMVDRDF
ncbi:MAG: polyprenyl synthetase family protein [Campylobacterales bacterium]|nr:polyprenyl synthetase family protein [Campylobacterales bacterium]